MSTCYHCEHWDQKKFCKITHEMKTAHSDICGKFLHIPACSVCRHYSGRRCQLGIVDFNAYGSITGADGDDVSDPEDALCRTGDFRRK